MSEDSAQDAQAPEADAPAGEAATAAEAPAESTGEEGAPAGGDEADSAPRQQLISVVVPCFNEESVIDEFHKRCAAALEGIPDLDHEIIFVDDGSSDATYSKLRALVEQDPHVRVVKFGRNFGHQIAITAGIDRARGDAVVVIDSDLQDPPEVIADMVVKWREGYDVAYGKRVDREGETLMKLITAKVFYRLLDSIVKIKIPTDVGDFRLMSRRATDELKRLTEQDRYVRGLVAWIGLKQTPVEYHREARFAGETKYPFRKMLKFALDGITSFSTMPLKIASWLGYATSGLAFLYLVSVFVQKFVFRITVEGWATIMVAMLFLGGVQLICLGVLGEYLGRIFMQLKPRPMYIIDEFLIAEGQPEGDQPFVPTGTNPVPRIPAATRIASKAPKGS